MRSLVLASFVVVFLFVALGHALAAPSASKLYVDPKAMALLEKVQAKLRSINTLSADWSYRNQYVYQGWIYHNATSGTVRVKRPNFAFVSTWWLERERKDTPWKKDYLEDLTVSDGRHQWLWDTYDDGINPIFAVKPKGENVQMDFVFPIYGFFNRDQSYAARVRKSQQDGSIRELRDMGTATYKGRTYHVLRWVHVSDKRVRGLGGKVVSSKRTTVTDSLYIGSDFLIHRMYDTTDNGQVDDIVIENIHLNATIADSSFGFKAPAGRLRPMPQQKPDGREEENL